MELIPENFYAAASFYDRIPKDGGYPIAGIRDAEDHLKYFPGGYNLGLLDLFGLITIRRGSPAPGQGWQIERIHRTPLGDALLTALYSGFFEDFDNVFTLADECEEKGESVAPFGVLQPLLKPYFPAWQNNLFDPKWPFRAGTYTFKVTLGSKWSRITIGAKQSWDDLAAIILHSVDFDNDHLYEFSYRNRFGFIQTINHPEMDEGPFTDEVLIGAAPLRVGQTLIYTFDFGDDWKFTVVLEQVDSDGTIQTPIILETQGEPPKQYPNWEDEDDEGDWDDEEDWDNEED